MAGATLKTIDEYITTFPKEVQKKLEKVRQTIKEAAPEASEDIKWSRPAFSDEDRILVIFAAFKHHIGFYVTPSTLETFSEELFSFKTGMGSIQFPHNQQLPTDLIRRITEYRAWESKEKGVKWKS